MPLESPLKQVAATAVPPIEVARVAAVVMLHSGREVRLRRLDEQVVVRRHQHERVETPTVDFDRTAEPVQPFLAVRIIAHNGTFLVTPRDDVVQRSGKFNP